MTPESRPESAPCRVNEDEPAARIAGGADGPEVKGKSPRERGVRALKLRLRGLVEVGQGEGPEDREKERGVDERRPSGEEFVHELKVDEHGGCDADEDNMPPDEERELRRVEGAPHTPVGEGHGEREGDERLGKNPEGQEVETSHGRDGVREQGERDGHRVILRSVGDPEDDRPPRVRLREPDIHLVGGSGNGRGRLGNIVPSFGQ